MSSDDASGSGKKFVRLPRASDQSYAKQTEAELARARAAQKLAEKEWLKAHGDLPDGPSKRIFNLERESLPQEDAKKVVEAERNLVENNAKAELIERAKQELKARDSSSEETKELSQADKKTQLEERIERAREELISCLRNVREEHREEDMERATVAMRNVAALEREYREQHQEIQQQQTQQNERAQVSEHRQEVPEAEHGPTISR